MHPVLFRLGPLTITSYGVTLAAACLLVAWLAQRAAARAPAALFPLHGPDLFDWVGWGALGGVVGGRVLYVAAHWDFYADAPLTVFALWEGGLVWYGGFLGGVAASAVYARRRGRSVLRCADQVIPFVALGHAIGRIGCFLNGCCYGTPTEAWFGVCFPGHTNAVVPAQLMESVGLLALYAALRGIQQPAALAKPGTVFGAYLIGYGALRWTIEWWRDNPAVGGSGWTLAQWLSVAAMASGAVLWVRSRKHAVDLGTRT